MPAQKIPITQKPAKCRCFNYLTKLIVCVPPAAGPQQFKPTWGGAHIQCHGRRGVLHYPGTREWAALLAPGQLGGPLGFSDAISSIHKPLWQEQNEHAAQGEDVLLRQFIVFTSMKNILLVIF